MRRIFHWITFLFLTFCLLGCENTGYRLTFSTPVLKSSDVQQIEVALKANNYHIAIYLTDKGEMADWRERKVEFPSHPGEVYTYFSKKLSDNNYAFVQIYINYIKDHNNYSNVEFRVENMYAGSIMPEVKTEIDSIGDLIYQDLSSKVGKENVTIERKEVRPPKFY